MSAGITDDDVGLFVLKNGLRSPHKRVRDDARAKLDAMYPEWREPVRSTPSTVKLDAAGFIPAADLAGAARPGMESFYSGACICSCDRAGKSCACQSFKGVRVDAHGHPKAVLEPCSPPPKETAPKAPDPTTVARRMVQIAEQEMIAVARNAHLARPRLDAAGDVLRFGGAVERFAELDRTAWVRIAIPENVALDLERYQSNPVVLWAHDSAELPIGRAEEIATDGGALRMRIKLDHAGLAAQVWAGITENMIRAVELLAEPSGSLVSASFVAYAQPNVTRIEYAHAPVDGRSARTDARERDPVARARQEMIERNRSMFEPAKGGAQ